MSNFASLLNKVMNGTNQAQGVDPPSALQGTRRTSSQAGFGKGGWDATSGGQGATLSEATLNELAFAELSMDHYGLEGDNCEIVCWLIKIDTKYRDIELLIIYIALVRSRNGGSTATLDFLRSQIFRVHVVSLLCIVVLVPHTKSYVTPLQERVANHMHDHPGIWKLSPEILDNSDQFMQLSSFIRTRLTTIRSQIKAKLIEARNKKLDINQVMYLIAPKSAAVSEAHRARWAWIMLLWDDFGAVVEAGEYQKEEFWSFIEHQLAATKKAIWTNPHYKTDERRYNKFVQVFMAALHKHNLKYPTRAQAGRPGNRPAWQAVLEELMGMGREIYAAMHTNAGGKDGEEDNEEDNEEEGEGGEGGTD